MRLKNVALVIAAVSLQGIAAASAAPVRPAASLPQVTAPVQVSASADGARAGAPVGQGDEMLGTSWPVALAALLAFIAAVAAASSGGNGSTSP